MDGSAERAPRLGQKDAVAEKWIEQLTAVNSRVVHGVNLNLLRRNFCEAFRCTEATFPRDFHAATSFLEKTAALPDPSNAQEILAHNKDYSNRLNHFLDHPEAFSSPALAAAYLQRLLDNGEEFDPKSHLVSAVLGASILAAIPNKNEAHNNAHFREVTLNAIKIIQAMEAYEAHKFSFEDKALILISCYIHDLLHNGENNKLYNAQREVVRYEPCAREKESYSAAEAYLITLGLLPYQRRIVRAALMGTELSSDPSLPAQSDELTFTKPDGNAVPLSRAFLTSLAYKHHSEGTPLPNLPVGLRIFGDPTYGKRATDIGTVVGHADLQGSFWSFAGFRDRGLRFYQEAERTRIQHFYSSDPKAQDMRAFAQNALVPDRNGVSMPVIGASQILLGPLLYEIQGRTYRPRPAKMVMPEAAP